MVSVLQLKGGGRTLVGVSDKTLDYYEIPETVTSIAKKAFKDCAQLREITIPGNVKNIGAEAFSGCSSLKDVIISIGVSSIGIGTFENCTSLERVDLPSGLVEIGAEAFNNCKSIRKISIPEGVTRIGKRSFLNCKSLEFITIADTVNFIGEMCFHGCSNLKEVRLIKLDPNTLYYEENIFDSPSLLKRILSVPNTFYNKYQNHQIANYFSSVVGFYYNESSNKSYLGENIQKYVSRKKLFEKGIPGLILLKLLGKSDVPGSYYYLKARIPLLVNSDRFNQLLKLYDNCWNIIDLGKRGWTTEMIIKYAGKPDLDLVLDSNAANGDQYKININQPQNKPYLLYEKNRISVIEKSEAFNKEREYKEHFYSWWDLCYGRKWPESVINFYFPHIEGVGYCYDKKEVIVIEHEEAFLNCLKIIKNSWSEKQLFNMGFSPYTIKEYLTKADLCISHEKYYYKDRVELVKKSRPFKNYSMLRHNVTGLFNKYLSGKMSISEYIDEVVINLRIIPQDQLIEQACISYNEYIYSNADSDFWWFPKNKQSVTPRDEMGIIATVCLNYMRHKETPYDEIRKIINNQLKNQFDLQEQYHDLLKQKVNAIIRETYPWINKHAITRFL